MTRKAKEILHGEVVSEGAGVRLRRLFGFFDTKKFDPFLLMDDFRSDKPKDFLRGFPWHPHRGIETITYVLKGDVEHGDSLGNKGVIGSGDVQWMTAGSGIIHQEMPKGDKEGRMYGFQLWLNLPADHKMMTPRYQGLTAAQIPTATLQGGVTAKIIAGSVTEASGNTLKGPVEETMVKPEYFDVHVPAGGTFSHTTSEGDTVFIYVYEGSGTSAEKELANPTILLYEKGNSISVTAGQEGISFLFFSGAPLNEPVSWKGPIVMNTSEELFIAFEEYNNGTFIKHKPL